MPYEATQSVLFLFGLAIGMLVQVKNLYFLLPWDILVHQKLTIWQSAVCYSGGNFLPNCTLRVVICMEILGK